MNSLSWFLYLIDVINALNTLANVCLWGSVLAIGACWIVCAIGLDKAKFDEKNGIRASRTTWSFRFLKAGAFASLFVVLLPGKSTMYAIAASEVGERVVKSEIVQGIASDATKALHQWIKSQIEPEKKG